MFKELSGKLVNCAEEQNIIKSEDAENCLYGLNTFLTLTVNILSAFAIGLFMNMLIEISLFILVFKSLRKYVGGSHAKTALRCYISSCAIYLIVLAVIKYYPLSKSITTAITILSAAILCVISPVEADKKPLDDIEKVVFGRRGRITVLIFLCLFALFCYIPSAPYLYYFATIIAVSMYAVTVLAIIGKLRLIQKNN